MQIEAVLDSMNDPQANVPELYTPGKMVLANSKGVQKEIAANLEKFKSLCKYQDKLQKLI